VTAVIEALVIVLFAVVSVIGVVTSVWNLFRDGRD
jgi:hypothetical protein